MKANISAKKESLLSRIRKGSAGYLMILPLMVGLLIFCYYPPVYGLILSFFDMPTDKTVEAVFVGLQNYKELFSDRIFLNSIPTMFKIMLPRLIISLVVPLVMAELIFAVRKSRLQNLYRVLILVPIVAPGVVGILIWKNLYDASDGLFTELTRLLGIIGPTDRIDWLNDSRYTIFSIVFMGFPWIGGTSVLIYLSGIMNISNEVFEAADLDGCPIMRRIFVIDIPLIMGQIRYFLIMGIINGLQDYSTHYTLTGGGPGYTTYVPGWYMYNIAFGINRRAGYAAAIGMVLFLVIMIITLFTYRLINGSKGGMLERDCL